VIHYQKRLNRMAAGVKAGRWLWLAPLGYINKERQIILDPERAPLVRKAFELIAPRYSQDGSKINVL